MKTASMNTKMFSILSGVLFALVVISPVAAHADDGYTGGGFDGGYSGGGYDGGYTGGGYDGGYTGGGYDVGYTGGGYDNGYTGGGYDDGYTGGGYDNGYTGGGYLPDETGYCGGSCYGSSYPSYGSYGGSSIGYSRPISYSYPSTPITFNAPSYPAPRPTPTPVSTPSNTVVNNTNNNTNVNNITNNNQSSAVAIATVTPVAAQPVQYPVIQYVQPVAQPYCTISISNYGGNSYGQYGYNQLATLTWSSTNTTNGYISPNVGTVSGYGSMQVYPTSGQTYTMTVYGQGGQATCSTQPFYIAQPVVYNNPTPHVSLSQIPYTGLDLGAVGNAIYWLSLVAFAGAAAYLVLYWNGGMLATLGLRKNSAIAETPKIQIAKAPAPIFAAASAPVAHKEQSVVSPIQILAANSSNSDTMHFMHSKAGEAPRIIISRE